MAQDSMARTHGKEAHHGHGGENQNERREGAGVTFPLRS